MKEKIFIEKNKQYWQGFEQGLKSDQKKPGRFWHTFVKITGDLAYARTFYPNRSVRVYLNYLSQLVYNDLSKTRKYRDNVWIRFWTHSIPMAMYRNRMSMYLALGVFILAFLAGYLSGVVNPDYVVQILGHEYVSMTRENIASGDPMAVYRSMAPMEMSFAITVNNIRVAFLTFICGILASVGTLGVLLYNAMMIAAFHKLLFDEGIVREMLLTVYMHGAMEISAIIIAGGAGLVLGKGLLFPGTHTRLEAFQLSSKEAIYIFIGTLPLFVIAGFVEGFVTRLTDIADWLRFLFIITSLGLVVFYYFIYPGLLASRTAFDEASLLSTLPAREPETIEFNSIKSIGEIISTGFTIMRRNALRILKWSVNSSLSFVLLMIGLLIYNYFPDWIMIEESLIADLQISIPFLFFFLVAFVMVWLHYTDKLTRPYRSKPIKQQPANTWVYMAGTGFSSWFIVMSLTSGTWFGTAVWMYVAGVLYLLALAFRHGISGSIPASKLIAGTLKHGAGILFALLMIGLLLGIFLYLISRSAFVGLSLEVLTWGIHFDPSWKAMFIAVAEWWLLLIALLFFLLMCKVFAELLQAHTFEIISASGLNQAIDAMEENYGNHGR